MQRQSGVLSNLDNRVVTLYTVLQLSSFFFPENRQRFGWT